MKLIKCYIENFGGLMQQEFCFSPGITVIEQPNGFGKTTLAEFIRAMFYGFPRANRNLEKNLRKKYLPWQGGKYGGNLVFEHNGKTYRIDRTFGSVPRMDTFALCDAVTRKKSLDFTENIGVELFELDADSFERSTYLPQLLDGNALSTESIQAKLGDLVEDSNDINNFSKAMSALKNKRSSYIPFRGNGGSVAEATEKMSELYEELSQADSIHRDLRESQEQLVGLREEKKIKDASLARIRQEITAGADYVARRSVAEKYGDMQKQQTGHQNRLRELEQQYALGIPTEEDLSSIEPLYDRMIALESQMENTPEDQEARAFIAASREKFANGVPDEETLTAREAGSRAYTEKEAELRNLELSPYEKQSLEELQELFREGVPEEEFIQECQKKSSQFQVLSSKITSQKYSAEDQVKRQNLEAFFSAGVPTQEELDEKNAQLKRVSELREENVRITAKQVETIREESPAAPAKKSPVPLILLLSVIAVAVGIVLLVKHSYAAGGTCLGLGVAAAIAAAYLNLRHMMTRELSASQSGGSTVSQQDRDQVRSNEQEIAVLEHGILEFVSRYISDERSLGEKMQEIGAKFSVYSALQEQEHSREADEAETDHQMKALAADLGEKLSPYGLEAQNFDACISALRENISRFDGLQDKKNAQQEKLTALKEQLSTLEKEISDFLYPYCGTVAPERFGETLSALRKVYSTYTSAEKRLAGVDKRNAEREVEMRACEETLQAFAEKYGRSSDLRDRTVFQHIRQDAAEYAALLQQLEEDKKVLMDFAQEHRDDLMKEPEAPHMDLEGLKASERQLVEETTELHRQTMAVEQRIRQKQNEADQLPGKQDDLERWKAKRQEDMDSSSLLDKTMDFLTKAKEALSDNYLGKIQQSFAGYMNRLTGEENEYLVVNADLNVQIERLGEARELAYFSVGQTDMITLCMRLALVDALFEDNKPFIILDDPFVNLDDVHTAQAIAMLKEFGKDHQIIYLTCNSSRTIKT